MMPLSLDAAISLFLSLFVGIVFARWIFYTLPEEKREMKKREDHLYQCFFCNYTFHHLGKDAIINCPRCHSYLNKEGL